MNLIARSKSLATALRKTLAEQNVVRSHSACLEIVARQLGFSNWNALKAASDAQVQLGMTIFVEHGREQDAIVFYEKALGAVKGAAYSHGGVLIGAELMLGHIAISVAGANPRRELEPSRGGPFFPKARGAVSTIFRLEVRDIDATLKQAIAAGASIRDEIQLSTNRLRAASFFDPFGYIWGLHENTSAVSGRKAMRAR